MVLVLKFGNALGPTVFVLASLALVLLKDLRDRQTRRRSMRPQLGGEKQLLITLRDLSSLTPIEAAMETCLSVDEAEEILTRLADRGHLRLESLGDALVYVLPGRGH